MMRSLYSGVSGLQNHQIRMDVIGNNISNVNTVGFKKGRVNFHDLISQSMSGAARPTDEVGGVNPQTGGAGHDHGRHRHDSHPGLSSNYRRDFRLGHPRQRILRHGGPATRNSTPGPAPSDWTPRVSW